MAIKLINKLKNIIIISFVFSFLFSCQSVEILDDVVFDNNLLTKISIHAEQKIINNIYEMNYVEPYIDHSIKHTPLLRLNNWLDQNNQNMIIKSSIWWSNPWIWWSNGAFDYQNRPFDDQIWWSNIKYDDQIDCICTIRTHVREIIHAVV